MRIDIREHQQFHRSVEKKIAIRLSRRTRAFQCESHEFFRVFLDLTPCRGDLLHVLFVTEKRRLWNPDGFPSRTTRSWILRLQEIMRFRCLRARKPLAVLAVLKHIER